MQGISTLGQISESTRVNKATKMQRNLVKKSKYVEKQEAGLLGDKNVKGGSNYAHSDTESFTQDEDMDSEGDLIRETKRKKQYKTQFEDYNERI